MTSDELWQETWRSIPGVRTRMDEQISYWSGVFGEELTSLDPDGLFTWVLAPHVIETARTQLGSEEKAQLKRVFRLIESLLEDENPAIAAAADTSFCEALLEDEEAYERVRSLMGPKLRDSAEYILARRR